jgi:hypothetical protein
MDEEFLEQRIRLVRSLSDKADLFIKRRLMDLANNYESMLKHLVPVTVLSRSVETPPSRNSSPEKPGS